MQVVVFNFIGKLVNLDVVARLRRHDADVHGVRRGRDRHQSSFMAVALGRVYSVIRQEQLQGTLESLLLTPTAFTTIQMGSVVYDIVYVPIRTFIFLGLTTLVFGTNFNWTGLLPTLAILVVFIPFVWGLGILAAAWTLTFKRGTGVVGIAHHDRHDRCRQRTSRGVLPQWAQALVQVQPHDDRAAARAARR